MYIYCLFLISAFRANLSSQLTLVSSSAAVVTVFISWQACPGVSADLSLQYNIMGSGSQQTVQPVTVSMPTDTVHIPVLNLESGRMYEYTIRLLSSGGVSLSDEERSSFLTEPEQQTECSSTAGSTSGKYVILTLAIRSQNDDLNISPGCNDFIFTIVNVIRLMIIL